MEIYFVESSVGLLLTCQIKMSLQIFKYTLCVCVCGWAGAYVQYMVAHSLPVQ